MPPGKKRCGGASGAAKKKHPDITAFNKLFLSKRDEQRVKKGVKVVCRRTDSGKPSEMRSKTDI